LVDLFEYMMMHGLTNPNLTEDISILCWKWYYIRQCIWSHYQSNCQLYGRPIFERNTLQLCITQKHRAKVRRQQAYKM